MAPGTGEERRGEEKGGEGQRGYVCVCVCVCFSNENIVTGTQAKINTQAHKQSGEKANTGTPQTESMLTHA